MAALLVMAATTPFFIVAASAAAFFMAAAAIIFYLAMLMAAATSFFVVFHMIFIKFKLNLYYYSTSFKIHNKYKVISSALLNNLCFRAFNRFTHQFFIEINALHLQFFTDLPDSIIKA